MESTIDRRRRHHPAATRLPRQLTDYLAVILFAVIAALLVWFPPLSTRTSPTTFLWGEGRGEGERGLRRFHRARSSEPDTLRTKFQFLAALDRNVRAPMNLRCAPIAHKMADRLLLPQGV